MSCNDSLARLEFCSSLDMLEAVEIVTNQVGRLVGMDEETVHRLIVSVRESVINAVTHGNRNDRRKQVFIEFLSAVQDGSAELTVLVRDQGSGFDPTQLSDPIGPDTLLKPDGRGVFLIRSFMDEVIFRRAPEGGMEIRMVKRARR